MIRHDFSARRQHGAHKLMISRDRAGPGRLLSRIDVAAE